MSKLLALVIVEWTGVPGERWFNLDQKHWVASLEKSVWNIPLLILETNQINLFRWQSGWKGGNTLKGIGIVR